MEFFAYFKNLKEILVKLLFTLRSSVNHLSHCRKCQLFVRGPLASILAPVSDSMDADYVHVINAGYAEIGRFPWESTPANVVALLLDHYDATHICLAYFRHTHLKI